MTDPFIIMCAPNGARRVRTDHPAIPLTAEELADCAEEILEAGASIMHLHVRSAVGGHSLDVELYRQAQAAIRDRVGSDLVIQVTSEAVGIYDRQQQMDMVRALRPEAVSLALREICPKDSDAAEMASLFTWMHEAGVFPQVILYDLRDLVRFNRFCNDGTFGKQAPFVLFVLGSYADDNGVTSSSFQYFTSLFSDVTFPWAVCAFGRDEYKISPAAALMGGHVRVGFENNIWREDGRLVASNGELVRKAVQSANVAGRRVASAADVRRMFVNQVPGLRKQSAVDNTFVNSMSRG